MSGLFLPEGLLTKLLPGDKLIFTQKDNGPETADFYRNEEKLFFDFPPHCLVGGDNEFPRKLLHTEKLKMAKFIAAVTGMELRTLEWGEKRTIFQFI